MEAKLDTLAILANVTIAFVAFAAIVATLRLTLGQRLSPLQRVLIRWFTETGMLVVSMELLPLVLAAFWQDEATIARYSIFYALFSSLLYFVFYARRRLRIKAPTPVTSVLVVITYMIWLPILALAGAGVFFQPSLAIVAAFSFWWLLGAGIIFATFLSTFIFDDDAGG